MQTRITHTHAHQLKRMFNFHMVFELCECTLWRTLAKNQILCEGEEVVLNFRIPNAINISRLYNIYICVKHQNQHWITITDDDEHTQTHRYNSNMQRMLQSLNYIFIAVAPSKRVSEEEKFCNIQDYILQLCNVYYSNVHCAICNSTTHTSTHILPKTNE